MNESMRQGLQRARAANVPALQDDMAATLQARLSWPQADACAADLMGRFRRRVRSGELAQIIGDLNGTGDVLGDSQRWQVEQARDILATWDLARDPDGPYMDRETVLADQLRALLEVIDEIAPKGER